MAGAARGMTLHETVVLDELVCLVQAIVLTDASISAPSGREITKQVRAISLFVRSLNRPLAAQALADVEATFEGMDQWAAPVAAKIARVRKSFGWDAT